LRFVLAVHICHRWFVLAAGNLYGVGHVGVVVVVVIVVCVCVCTLMMMDDDDVVAVVVAVVVAPHNNKAALQRPHTRHITHTTQQACSSL